MQEFAQDVQFWTGIMRDHAIFQQSTLAPKEQEYIQYATYYRDFFESMLNEIKSTSDIRPVIPNLYQGVICFIEFKRMILQKLLTCGLQINLSPSFFNHQINEAMEFKSLLENPYQKCPIHMGNLASYIKKWLSDAAGHAAAIASFLDPVESLLIDEANKFKEIFTKLTIKASELELMINRTGVMDGSTEFLAEEAIEWLNKFICFADKIRKLRGSCKAMANGTMLPLIPDHFIREHRYAISKIKTCLAKETKKSRV
ncbi:MAG: DUF2935 domain-containing protein [Clostridia bacterium]|nr:DUF2935 domain-containing protein [Clostridia bacterium]